MATRPLLYITQQLPEVIIARFSKDFRVEMWEEPRPIPHETLIAAAAEAEAILVMLTDSIDEAFLASAKQLKIIATMSVGHDHIDMKAARKYGIKVTNTPSVLTEATADLSFALMMAAGRRLVEASDYVRDGKWVSWQPMLLAGQDIYGATLGIIGMGKIGEAVARRARGFDMEIIYHNRSRSVSAEKATGASYCTLDELLSRADFVVLLTPLTPETEGLMGAREFSLMKPSSVFINVSRGATVDEEALHDALATGKIWAAGLDVFREEPVPLDHPLLSLPNVTVLPHIGSASIKTRIAMGMLAANSIIAYFNGQPLENEVK